MGTRGSLSEACLRGALAARLKRWLQRGRRAGDSTDTSWTVSATGSMFPRGSLPQLLGRCFQRFHVNPVGTYSAGGRPGCRLTSSVRSPSWRTSRSSLGGRDPCESGRVGTADRVTAGADVQRPHRLGVRFHSANKSIVGLWKPLIVRCSSSLAIRGRWPSRFPTVFQHSTWSALFEPS